MPVDVDGTKLTLEEANTLAAMIQLNGRLASQLRGLEEIMDDTEFITRSTLILDMIETLDKEFGKEIKQWKKDVERQ